MATSQTEIMAPEDSDLLSGFRRGDGGAIDAVRSWITRTTRSYCPPLRQEDAEDIEQDLLLELGISVEGAAFAGRSKFQTYVKNAAHYKCIDRLRAHRRRTWVDVEELDLLTTEPSPFDDTRRKEAVRLAGRVLDQMPAHCRRLWAMIDEGLSYREMSEIEGVKEGALRARVLRCRRKAAALRSQLRRP